MYSIPPCIQSQDLYLQLSSFRSLFAVVPLLISCLVLLLPSRDTLGLTLHVGFNDKLSLNMLAYSFSVNEETTMDSSYSYMYYFSYIFAIFVRRLFRQPGSAQSG